MKEMSKMTENHSTDNWNIQIWQVSQILWHK